jgi:hypothetical protein
MRDPSSRRLSFGSACSAWSRVATAGSSPRASPFPGSSKASSHLLCIGADAGACHTRNGAAVAIPMPRGDARLPTSSRCLPASDTNRSHLGKSTGNLRRPGTSCGGRSFIPCALAAHRPLYKYDEAVKWTRDQRAAPRPRTGAGDRHRDCFPTTAPQHCFATRLSLANNAFPLLRRHADSAWEVTCSQIIHSLR